MKPTDLGPLEFEETDFMRMPTISDELDNSKNYAIRANALLLQRLQEYGVEIRRCSNELTWREIHKDCRVVTIADEEQALLILPRKVET